MPKTKPTYIEIYRDVTDEGLRDGDMIRLDFEAGELHVVRKHPIEHLGRLIPYLPQCSHRSGPLLPVEALRPTRGTRLVLV